MKTKTSITILVDNHGTDPGLGTEHGWAVWIETGDHHILFDTGQTDLLLENAKALGIDLSQTDYIVLSHGHYDHTGGLLSVLRRAPRATLFMHSAAKGNKFSRKQSEVRDIGMSESTRKALIKHRVIWTDSPTQICPGLHVTGQVPRFNPWEDVGGDFYLDRHCHTTDPVLDDQSLWIEHGNGQISVILGCTHSGIINTLHYIAGLAKTDAFDLLLGGLHLANADQERLIQTELYLKKHPPKRIVPGHCTGEKIIEQFSQIFKTYSPCHVGKRFEL